MIEVQGPDGTIAEFPDGTSPDIMKSAMAKRFGGPQAAPEFDEMPETDAMGNPTGGMIRIPKAAQPMPYKEQIGNAAGMIGRGLDNSARMIANGATLGLADKIAAGAQTAGGTLGNYPDELARQRAQTADIEKNYPGSSAVLKGVGSTMALGGLARAGIPIMGTGSNILEKGVTSGLVNGGISAGAGALNSDGDIAERSVAGLKEGAQGFLVGGGATVAGWGIGRGVKAAQDLISHYRPQAAEQAIGKVGLSTDTAQMLTRALERDGLSGHDAQAALAQLGERGMIADLGPNTRTVLEAIAQRPGAGQTIARDALYGRQATTGETLLNSADENLGRYVSPQQFEAQMEGVRKNEISPLYRRVFEGENGVRPTVDLSGAAENTAKRGANRGSEIGRANDRLVSDIKGVGTGAEEAVPASRTPVTTPDGRVIRYEAKPAKPGKPADISAVDAERAADLKKTLETRGGDYQVVPGAKTPVQVDAENLGNQAAKDVRKALREQVPGYADANDKFRELVKQKEAFPVGQKALRDVNVSPEDLQATISEMSPKVKNALMLGSRADVESSLRNNVNDLNALTKLVKGEGDWGRQKLRTIFGAKADNLIEQLDREGVFKATTQTVLGNSRTAARQVADEELRGVAGAMSPVEDTGGVVKSLANMKVGDAASKFWDKVQSNRIDRNLGRIGEQGAKGLTAQGSDAKELIMALQGVKGIEARREALRRMLEHGVGNSATVRGLLNQMVSGERDRR